MSAALTLKNAKDPLGLFSRVFVEKEVKPLVDHYAGPRAENHAKERAVIEQLDRERSARYAHRQFVGKQAHGNDGRAE
jgi:hypothetical protein